MQDDEVGEDSCVVIIIFISADNYDSLFSAQIDVITNLKPWHIALTPDIWKRKVGGDAGSQICCVMYTKGLLVHFRSCCCQG